MAGKKGGRKSKGKRSATKRAPAKRAKTKAVKSAAKKRKNSTKPAASAAQRQLLSRAAELDRREAEIGAREARIGGVERHLTRRDIVARITARAWAEPEYKQRLLDDPVSVLNEAGLNVPPGLKIYVHADSPGIEHGVLMSPPSTLTPEEIESEDPDNVHFMYCFTAFHGRS